jgi:hypothetical protein
MHNHKRAYSSNAAKRLPVKLTGVTLRTEGLRRPTKLPAAGFLRKGGAADADNGRSIFDGLCRHVP